MAKITKTISYHFAIKLPQNSEYHLTPPLGPPLVQYEESASEWFIPLKRSKALNGIEKRETDLVENGS